MGYWRTPKARETPKNDVSLRRLIRSREAAAPAASDGPYAAKVTCLAEIDSESATWLWGHVIPLGKVTTLTGDAGVGKTFLSLNIAASVTRGESAASLKRGQGRADEAQEDEPGNVMLISSEDDLADVVGPRMICCGERRLKNSIGKCLASVWRVLGE